MKFLKLLIIPLSLILVSVLFLSCSEVRFISGAGDIITRHYEIENFDEIEISSNFKTEIIPSDSYSVTITTYENIFEHIHVSQRENILIIEMQPGSFTNASRVVEIALPEIYRLSLSGAVEGNVKGFRNSDSFILQESGASSLDIDMETGDIQITASGASNITGQINTLNINMELSGASTAELTGSADNVVLEISGASRAGLENFLAEDVAANVSGASTVNVNINGRLDADVSGASTLNYSGEPVLGSVEVTGASSLNPQ